MWIQPVSSFLLFNRRLQKKPSEDGSKLKDACGEGKFNMLKTSHSAAVVNADFTFSQTAFLTKNH